MAVGLCCAVAFVSPANAQANPPLPRDQFEQRLDRQGDSIVFCINPDAMMVDFERDLAEEIGSILLLDVDFYEFDSGRPTKPLDYRQPLTTAQLFLTLVENCNAMMGFTLTDTYPEWLSVTRPYLATPYVLAVRDAAYRSLGDIPRDQAIGTRSGNVGDVSLIAYLQALPEANRWPRYPYFDNQILLDRLADGSVAAALIWQPALYYATGGDPESAGLRIATLPFAPRTTQIGIAVMAEDVFLRTSLDQAIDVLVADGTIDALFAAHNLAPANE